MNRITLALIFRFLSNSDLCKCFCVNRLWCSVSFYEKFWVMKGCQSKREYIRTCSLTTTFSSVEMIKIVTMDGVTQFSLPYEFAFKTVNLANHYRLLHDYIMIIDTETCFVFEFEKYVCVVPDFEICDPYSPYATRITIAGKKKKGRYIAVFWDDDYCEYTGLYRSKSDLSFGLFVKVTKHYFGCRSSGILSIKYC